MNQLERKRDHQDTPRQLASPAPRKAALEADRPLIVWSPIPVGGDATEVVTVANRRPMVQDIGAARIVGVHAADFELMGRLPPRIGVGGLEQVSVRCRPRAPGLRVAQLRVVIQGGPEWILPLQVMGLPVDQVGVRAVSPTRVGPGRVGVRARGHARAARAQAFDEVRLGILGANVAAYRGAVDALKPDLVVVLGRRIVDDVRRLRESSSPDDERTMAELGALSMKVGPQTFRADAITSAPTPGDPEQAIARDIAKVVELLRAALVVVELVGRGARRAAVTEVARWRRRPADFLFLRRVLVLENVWVALDGIGATNDAGESLTSMERDVRARQQRDGAFTDGAMTGKFKVVVRSFAPFKQFGGGFEGDNRGFSAAPTGVTSRISQSVDIDLDSGSKHSAGPVSDPSRFRGSAITMRALRVLTLKGKPWGSATAKSKDQSKLTRVEGADQYELKVPLAASNPLIRGTSDIDVTAEVRLSMPEPGVLRAEGGVTGDAFPNFEVLLVDAAGASILVYTYATSHGGFVGPTFFLAGESKTQMGEFGLNLRVTGDGRFLGVQQGALTIPVPVHNGAVERKGGR